MRERVTITLTLTDGRDDSVNCLARDLESALTSDRRWGKMCLLRASGTYDEVFICQDESILVRKIEP